MLSALKTAVVPIALCLSLVLPAVAAADGDPASDYLLAQNVYYPFSPPVSGPLQGALNAETATAARSGFPINVAIIEARDDLGAVGLLLGQPQTYASFLEREINFTGEKPLLVVMANGYGVQSLPRASTTAAMRLPPPRGHTSNDLATAALAAVARLAAADGHRITPETPGLARAPSPADPSLPIASLGAATVFIAGATVYARRRHGALASRGPKDRG
ncbi:MAG: hypothetical protein WBQ18_08700 [Solirubrobacteraceae bacterium]